MSFRTAVLAAAYRAATDTHGNHVPVRGLQFNLGTNPQLPLDLSLPPTLTPEMPPPPRLALLPQVCYILFIFNFYKIFN